MDVLLATRTDVTLRAERLVRDPSLFKWYAVALLAFVIYAYANEVERGRWDVVAAGAAVWVADWFNEIVNALILQATDRAPLWATTVEGCSSPGNGEPSSCTTFQRGSRLVLPSSSSMVCWSAAGKG